MKKLVVNLLFIFSISGVIAACGSSQEVKSVETKPVDTEALEDLREDIKGKLGVYDSMARATKYNVHSLYQAMDKNVSETKLDNMQATQIVNEVKSLSESKHELYASMRALDFAVIYADAIVRGGNPEKREELLYKKSAESLALAAIKYHKDVLFVHKKNREIARIISREQKNVADINQKFEKTGRLPEEDVEYLKSLEVLIQKFADLNARLAVEVEDYIKLIKAKEKDKINLEGKMFYEIDDFDKSLTIDLFQRNAVLKNDDFISIINPNKNYSFSNVESISTKRFPDVERLIINGYNIDDDIYRKSLRKRSDTVAADLIRDAKDYKLKTNEEEKRKAGLLVAESLAIAIFTQIEMAYNIVHLNDLKIEEISEEIKASKEVLKNLEKSKKDDREKHIELLKTKLSILENEHKLSKLKADRAVAIRALYFYSGFDMLDTGFDSLEDSKLLDKPVDDISKGLKAAFNKDAVLMLAQIKEVKKISEPERGWARKDNWLENLVEGENAVRVVETQKPVPNIPYVSDSFGGDFYSNSHNDRKYMQLGAYINIENLNNDWEFLYNKYPELRGHIPEASSVMVNGVEMHRLVVRSEEGGFVDICNRIRQDGRACILR